MQGGVILDSITFVITVEGVMIVKLTVKNAKVSHTQNIVVLRYFTAEVLSSAVGHGRSEGDRVHVETFNTYTADVIQHVERKKEEYPDVPCLLMGHSMVSACHQLCTHRESGDPVIMTVSTCST